MNRSRSTAYLAGCLLAICTGAGLSAQTVPAPSHGPGTAVAQLLQKELIANPAKEIVMLTVTYPPGGSSRPHRHDAQVFVYVLEGAVTMQVRGQPAVTLHPGGTFYEAPDDVHMVSANASDKVPAKFLVVMIKDKSRPASRSPH